MSARPGLGFTLQPDETFLQLLEPEVLPRIDYAEVAPETLWRPTESGSGELSLEPNGFHDHFAALRDATGLAFVAHGVGFSVGSAQPDRSRRAAWLAAIARDHARFEFGWYTDHLGVSEVAGQELALPLPLPRTPEAAACVRTALGELQAIVPDVGFENSVFYHHYGDPLDEPAWLADALDLSRAHLLLDLHNVYTTALNSGFDPHAYLERLPLERVIELHVSGGSESDAAWLPSRRVLRLDSHDDAVPEPVWELLDHTLPRVPNLRGLTLERMEGTVAEADVGQVVGELERARGALEACGVR